MIRNILLAGLALLVLFLVGQSFFTVHQTQQALVLRFGSPVGPVRDPGLHMKIPFAEEVRFLDRRILNLDVLPQEVIASDQKRLVVDAFARFRIIDPLLTYQRVRDEDGARDRLGTILSSNLRQVLGRQAFITLLSPERATAMNDIRVAVNAEAADLGIEIVDVRIKRADLPAQNAENIYQRMNAEREREAREARAEGQEQAVRIKAQADRERTVLLAEAERDSAILRGEGDREAVRIFAEAFGKDEEFFAFYRTMQAYRKALNSDDTTMILSPDSDFFSYFGDFEGAGARK